MAPNQFHQLAPFPPYRHTATIKEERALLIQPIPKCKNSFQWKISEYTQSHGVKRNENDPTTASCALSVSKSRHFMAALNN